MIQRIQTVYLFLAAALSVACLFFQIGVFNDGFALVSKMYNLFSIDMMSNYSFRQWPLFVVLLLEAAVGFYAIFVFRNRKAQSYLCLFALLLIVGWYTLFAVMANLLVSVSVSFTPSLSAVLPLLSAVFYVLARRAIIHDEKLVKAADRIR